MLHNCPISVGIEIEKGIGIGNGTGRQKESEMGSEDRRIQFRQVMHLI